MERISRCEAEVMHEHTLGNREEILRSSRCWCICCEKEFPATEIDDWVEGDDSALCPFCYVDAVIGDASRIPLTKRLIHQLNKIYF